MRLVNCGLGVKENKLSMALRFSHVGSGLVGSVA
jgi:hypothetical protein